MAAPAQRDPFEGGVSPAAERDLALATLHRAAAQLWERAGDPRLRRGERGEACLALQALADATARLLEEVRRLADEAERDVLSLGGAPPTAVTSPGDVTSPRGDRPAGAGRWPTGLVPVAGLRVPARIAPANLDGAAALAAVAEAAGSAGLCYIPAWDHFAVSVGGEVLHGNVGEVAPPGGKPRRTVPCWGRGICRNPTPTEFGRCPYYHDPERWPGSREARGHALWRPASRDNLAAEVWLGDRALAESRAMHELLYAVLVARVGKLGPAPGPGGGRPRLPADS